jgi:hypothetical protein
VWSEGGRAWDHSIEEELISEFGISRLALIASQMIALNISTATKEVYLPKEDTTFHEVNISG